MGAISHSIHWLSTRATGRMISSLLRSEPIAILRMMGSSRSAAMPCTNCGVTAVSSTTTPAAFAVAFPAAAPTSSTEAAASFAITATSSSRPNSPALMARRLDDARAHRASVGGAHGLAIGVGAGQLLDRLGVGVGGHDGQPGGVLEVLLGVAEG